jgi:hypothetical protein
MKPAVARLALAVVLFVSWVGYLGYLAWATSHPIVLSRPQFLVSNLDVIAHVEPSEAGVKVTVDKVHWPRTEEAKKLEGSQIEVAELTDAAGWNEPGTYILPLTRDTKGTYRVAPIPPSPGYNRAVPKIYVANPQTLYQLETIRKPEAVELKK